MVEVFKTNVGDRTSANILLDRIHKTFIAYEANFDLEDCDRILRVHCETGDVPASPLIALLQEYGFIAEVLPDEPVQQKTSTRYIFMNLHNLSDTPLMAS